MRTFYCNPLPQCFSTDKSFIIARQTDKISEVSIDTVHHSRLNKCVQFSNLGRVDLYKFVQFDCGAQE